MKNLNIIICFLMLGSGSLMSQAPSYTDFEWDIFGFGLAIPIAEDQLSNGFTMGGEIRFNATDYLSVGVGSDLTFYNLKNLENVDDEDVSINFSTSTFISADYYFNSTSPYRAFAGLAFGSSDIGDIEIMQEGDDVDVTEGPSGLSLSPRIGFEYDHFRFQLHYNIGLKEELTNYLAVKISLTLWGGYQGSSNEKDMGGI